MVKDLAQMLLYIVCGTDVIVPSYIIFHSLLVLQFWDGE